MIYSHKTKAWEEEIETSYFILISLINHVQDGNLNDSNQEVNLIKMCTNVNST